MSVPVLSKATTRTPASASTIWPPRTRQPRRASRPIPSEVARAPARPSPQGQATTRTARPASSAWSSGVRSRPDQHGETREDEHGRNEGARDPIRQALRVARLGQGLAHGAGDPAQRVAVPAPVLRMTSAPSWLMLPASAAAPGILATGRLSPVITASSTWEEPSTTTPSTPRRSPGRTSTSVPAVTSRTRRRVSAPPSRTVTRSRSTASIGARLRIARARPAASR